jgi:hypothetical protein
METGVGTSETVGNRMARFDALPTVVRSAINYAAFEFHPRIAERMLRRGVSPDRYAELLSQIDKRLMRKGGAA